MKRKTKKDLANQVRQLESQVAAMGGQTRKTLNARVHAAEQENKQLKSKLAGIEAKVNENETRLRNQISELQGKVKELETQVSA